MRAALTKRFSLQISAAVPLVLPSVAGAGANPSGSTSCMGAASSEERSRSQRRTSGCGQRSTRIGLHGGAESQRLECIRTHALSVPSGHDSSVLICVALAARVVAQVKLSRSLSQSVSPSLFCSIRLSLSVSFSVSLSLSPVSICEI